MARGKRGKRKNRRGDSEYTKRSKARQDKRARVAEATGQRGFSVSNGGGKRKRKSGAGGPPAGGARAGAGAPPPDRPTCHPPPSRPSEPASGVQTAR